MRLTLVDYYGAVLNAGIREVAWWKNTTTLYCSPLPSLRSSPRVMIANGPVLASPYPASHTNINLPPLLERIAFRLPSGTRSRRLFELSHLNRNYLQFSSVQRILRLGNEVCSEVDFFCNRLGALRRAVLTVRLERFESE
ncbi:hypothetical protein J6590_090906 [Homalodisca vitripennis]|nr:hypothetical protein J6590_090906 [Homalodisca vitripennis]